MPTVDPLYYQNMDGLPEITLEAWLKICPLFFKALRDSKTDLDQLKAEWDKADVNPALGYLIVDSLGGKELLRLPPRRWTGSTEATIGSDVLTLIKVRKTAPHYAKQLESKIANTPVDVGIPPELAKAWKQLLEDTRPYLKGAGIVSQPIEGYDEGEEVW